MPYIEQKRRDALDPDWDVPRTPGELNYVITRVVCKYINARDFNYQVINDVVGALECAKKEFYERIAIPYERTKCQQNGDVYT